MFSTKYDRADRARDHRQRGGEGGGRERRRRARLPPEREPRDPRRGEDRMLAEQADVEGHGRRARRVDLPADLLGDRRHALRREEARGQDPPGVDTRPVQSVEQVLAVGPRGRVLRLAAVEGGAEGAAVRAADVDRPGERIDSRGWTLKPSSVFSTATSSQSQGRAVQSGCGRSTRRPVSRVESGAVSRSLGDGAPAPVAASAAPGQASTRATMQAVRTSVRGMEASRSIERRGDGTTADRSGRRCLR